MFAKFLFLMLTLCAAMAPLVLRADDDDDKEDRTKEPERRISPEMQAQINEIELLDKKAAFKALEDAILSGNLLRTRVILHLNPDFLNKQDTFKRTPLYNAAFANQLEIVKLLLSRRADTSIGNVNGDTPLHAAAEAGWMDVVKFLVDRGASIFITNSRGETPLFKAVLGGQPEVATFLIDKGLLVDGLDLKRNTPLHRAAQRGDDVMVDFLLRSGADKARKNADGQTPADLAANPELKEKLRAK